MPKKKPSELKGPVAEELDYRLDEDYVEEYEEAKVTLAEEEVETFDLGEGEAKESVALAKPYTRKRQHKLINQADAEEIKPTAFQPGLLVRRLRK